MEEKVRRRGERRDGGESEKMRGEKRWRRKREDEGREEMEEKVR